MGPAAYFVPTLAGKSFCTHFGGKKVHFYFVPTLAGKRCMRILYPLWQGRGAFLRLPRSISASGYKHFKCYVTMLQCRIWGRGTGNAGEWKALTQGTQGKKRRLCRSIPASIFLPVFPLSVAGKLNEALFPDVPSHSVHDPQLTPELRPG